jgi:Tol biopolymer transport system component
MNSEYSGSFLPRRLSTLPAVFTTLALIGGLVLGCAPVARAQFVRTTRNSEPAWSPDGRQIAFASDREWPTRIYVIDSNGRNVHRVTCCGTAHDHNPTWSPDGHRIAFDRMPWPVEANDRHDIWVVRTDGTGEVAITSALPNARYEKPAWSPDGRWIAMNELSGNDQTLLLVSPDGRESLALNVGPGMSPDSPAWSPDSKRLAFSSYSKGDGKEGKGIYVIEVATGVVSRLTTGPDNAYDPSWSPDGRQIAFRRIPDDANGTLDFERGRMWLMDAEGKNQHQVGDVKTSLTATARSPAGDAFVVARNTGDSSDLFVVRTDGTVVRRLTWSGWADLDPAWSPDGQSIAYVALRDEKASVQVIAADGSRVTPVATSFKLVEHPSWAPGSDQLVFIGSAEGIRSEKLYVVKADGLGLRPIIEAPGEDSRYDTPAWSRDGKRIAFTMMVLAYAGIVTVPATGGKPHMVSRKFGGREPVRELDPAWSPDGKHFALACSSGRERGICTMDQDGKNSKRLTMSSGYNGEPTWSPDGTYIAFTTGRDGPLRIYVMNADGSGLRRLSDGPGHDFTASWAPGGKRLVFVSTREGRPALYLMNADGSGVTRLTRQPGQDADSARVGVGR